MCVILATMENYKICKKFRDGLLAIVNMRYSTGVCSVFFCFHAMMYTMYVKVKESIAVYGNPSHSYGVRSVTCRMGSHSVTCHRTQANTPRLHPSQTGWYSIYCPFKGGGLSKPRPRVQRATGPLLLRDSPGPGASEARTQDLAITSPARYRVTHVCMIDLSNMTTVVCVVVMLSMGLHSP